MQQQTSSEEGSIDLDVPDRSPGGCGVYATAIRSPTTSERGERERKAIRHVRRGRRREIDARRGRRGFGPGVPVGRGFVAASRVHRPHMNPIRGHDSGPPLEVEFETSPFVCELENYKRYVSFQRQIRIHFLPLLACDLRSCRPTGGDRQARRWGRSWGGLGPWRQKRRPSQVGAGE
jgi:hypothetical protein